LRLPDNAPGPVFVDESCIDCDLCRQLAPEIFTRAHGQSVVARQPQDEQARLRAAVALVTCPTASIGGAAKPDIHKAVESLPESLGGGVYFCGYASEDSFGAASYFIRRPEGNVLVDSPRAAKPLMDRLEALGGVRLMFLTHRDDVADHEAYRRRFGCERILHEADVTHSTRGVERRLTGSVPVELEPGLLAIPTPGHTRGSQVLLWNRHLFTGDHLWARSKDEGEGDGDGLEAGRGVCWYSWEEQTRSMERLLGYDFEQVLPGHGRRRQCDTAQMKREMQQLVSEMRGRG
jgi:glyoxylase-like metal-dependent hydrolase (beta-lactamase superfamily II)/ferredoxin